MKKSIKNRVYIVGFRGYLGESYVLASSSKEARKIFTEAYPKLPIIYITLIQDTAGIL